MSLKFKWETEFKETEMGDPRVQSRAKQKITTEKKHKKIGHFVFSLSSCFGVFWPLVVAKW